MTLQLLVPEIAVKLTYSLGSVKPPIQFGHNLTPIYALSAVKTFELLVALHNVAEPKCNINTLFIQQKQKMRLIESKSLQK